MLLQLTLIGEQGRPVFVNGKAVVAIYPRTVRKAPADPGAGWETIVEGAYLSFGDESNGVSVVESAEEIAREIADIRDWGVVNVAERSREIAANEAERLAKKEANPDCKYPQFCECFDCIPF